MGHLLPDLRPRRSAHCADPLELLHGAGSWQFRSFLRGWPSLKALSQEGDTSVASELCQSIDSEGIGGPPRLPKVSAIEPGTAHLCQPSAR